MAIAQTHRQSPHWNQVALFLGITFGLTFLLNLLLYFTVGYGQNAGTGVLLQLQTLIPATVAIALQLFVFRNSRIYHLRERPRWFFYFYLAYTLIFAILAAAILFASNTAVTTIASASLQILTIGGLVFVFVLRLVSGREAFERAGLAFGKLWHWLAFGLVLVGIYLAMTGLNILFDLGAVVDVRAFLIEASGGQATMPESLSREVILLTTGLQAVILAPIVALLVAFGEEYGWRGYLQGELIKVGKARGILLVGLIWGLWHAPVILMGHNYPDQPVLGVLLMTVYSIALAFFFGYAVLVSGSVWLAAFLHALNNQVVSFLMLMVYRPDDAAFSFGIGAYGLVVWAIVVAAIMLLLHRQRQTVTELEKESPLDAPYGGSPPGYQ
jgi:membrane protease YdiL (CAAX protease family)